MIVATVNHLISLDVTTTGYCHSYASQREIGFTWKIRLALATGACFIPFNLQLERKSPGFGPVAKAALAGLFAALLLWSTTLAVSTVHRQSHHSTSTAAHQTCVLCLFAHGQITAADTAVALTAGTGAWIDLPSSPGSETSASFDYRLSPSRAPPFRFSV